jgi:hypothetical protein
MSKVKEVAIALFCVFILSWFAMIVFQVVKTIQDMKHA